MADNSWVNSIGDKIFTIIKAKTFKIIKADFPKVRYTQNDENIEPVVAFPTILIQLPSNIPSFNDLEKDRIDDTVCTFLVRVTVNTQKSDALKIANQIMEAFISLNFDIVSAPITSSNGSVHIANARYRRKICYDDKI